MRRRILFRTGKILEWLGGFLAAPFNNMFYYGEDMWVRHCNCEMCLQRDREARDD